MRPGEGLTVPSQVNYVAKGANLHRFGAVPAGTAAVARSWLGTSWLWDKVRVQGGAYGGSCSFDRLSGCFTFLSYRDPNLMATLDIFDQSGEVLAEAEIATRELGRTIVGTVGDLDRHLLADAKGFTSMQRWLTGDTDEARQALREEVLAVTRGDLHRFAALLSEVARQGRVVVLGSDQAIAAANALRPGLLAVSRLL
jgi:Zn-dependent M16 (insulinase) family peptidase